MNQLASVAQGLEHWSCKPGVKSSNLFGGCVPFFNTLIFFMLIEVAYFVLQLQTNMQIDRLTFFAYDFSFCCVKNGEKLTHIVTNGRTGISRYTKANILSVKLSCVCAEMLKIKLRW